MSPVVAVAVVAATMAGQLALSPRPPAPATDASPTPRRALVLVGAVTMASAAVLLAPGRAVLVVLLGLVGWAGWRMWRARRAGLDRAATEARVLDACDQLAAELASGQPSGTALARVADEWPLLAPVAEASRMAGDVPAAWRVAAAAPGAGDLRQLAAAWAVSHRAGHGLGAAVERVAADLRRVRSTRRVVQGELASARATARLVGALPLVALLMGSGAGGDPWGFLLDTPAGLACLAAGLGLGIAGLAWIEAIARGVEAS